MHSVKSEHLLRQTPGLYPDKLDLQDQDSHLYGPIGQLVIRLVLYCQIILDSTLLSAS